MDITDETSSDAALLREHALRWVEQAYDDLHELSGRAHPQGFDPDIAREVAAQGFLGVMVPEAKGGTGGGLAEMAGIMEAVGRGIVAEPVLSVGGIAAPLLARLETPEADAFLAQLVAGESTAVLVHYESARGFDRSVTTGARQDGADVRLSGEKANTLDLAGADTLLVTALDANGRLGLYRVDPAAEGVTLKIYRTVDGRTTASLTLADASAERLSGSDDIAALVDETLDAAAFLVCAEALGAMRNLVDVTADYLKTRKQFGQTLDRFQVLQHRIVSMLLATEETAGVVEAVIDATQPRRARAIALCKTVTARSARYVAQQSVQLHGGIGVTDELKISRYFKRLMMCESLFGDEDYYTARYEALRPPA